MSANLLVAWLDDGTLSRLADPWAFDPVMWGQRHDPTCPSEFYRGYATLLVRFGDAFRSNPNLVALGRLVDAFDVSVKALPADERRNGASFALMNVAGYARAGTAPQVSATLSAELGCIARCFLYNRAQRL